MPHDAPTFDADPWRRARAHFDRLADAPAAERQAAVDQMARDDPAAAAVLRDLFDHDAPSEAFLARPVLRDAPPIVDRAGHELGAYRLIREVGRGGAGVVYLAERRGEDFEQRVAIKILHRQFHPDARRRFHLERRILARLQHPAIARLIDGGAAPDGSPYVVMEWVDGEPVTTWCDRQALGLRQRLELFRSIALGVQHAHRNLIVHRDLKPSNILIDAEGQAKLLDFGIAKLLADEAADGVSADTVAATVDSRWLSPGYASPEQILGGTISTASDVYALGLLLYELLVGESPQPKRASQLVRFATEGEVGAPSRHPEQRLPFQRRLRGDLDAIVVQATERESDRRYGSIELLLADIDRYLEGRPVEARRAGALYRARRFARRHLAATSIAVLLAAVVIAFSLYSALQAQRLAEQRDQAERRRVAAETLSDVLVEVVRSLDPVSGRQRDERTKAVLDQGRASIERRFAEEADVEAELLLSFGSVYRRLAYFDESSLALDRALERAGVGSSVGTPETTDHRRHQGEILAEIGRLELDRGDLAAAEARLRSAIDELSGSAPADLAARSAALESLAQVRRQQTDLQQARELLAISLALARTAGVDPSRIAEIELEQARIEIMDNHPEEALTLIRSALDVLSRRLGPEHPRVANANQDLGTVLVNSGRYREAQAPLEKALRLRRLYFGDDHPSTSASLFNLSIVHARSGNHRAAIPLMQQILRLDRHHYGDDHAFVAGDLATLGLSYWQTGEAQLAVDHLAEALELYRRLFEPDHLEIAICLDNLGLALADVGRLGEAEAAHREALSIRRRRPPSERWHQGDSQLNLARLALLRGHLDQVTRHLDAARDAFDQSLPDLAAWQQDRLDSLRGAVLAATAPDDPSVELLLRESFEGLARHLELHDRRTRNAAQRLERWLEGQGRLAEAEAIRARIVTPRTASGSTN